MLRFFTNYVPYLFGINILQNVTNDGLSRLVTNFNTVFDQQFRNNLPSAARYIEYVFTTVLSK